MALREFPIFPASPITRREVLALLATTFVALPLTIIALAGPAWIGRPFWADEVLTWLLASDPSLPHALAALAGGVDTNAPLLHVALHFIGAVTGHSPIAYRVLAMFVTSISVVGLYLLLRSRVNRGPAAVGCAAFASMPLVIAHAAEARFYGLFVAASIWTAFALQRRRDRPTLANAIGVAVASATLCGSHYFGVIALGCIAVGEAIASRRTRADRLYPTLAGLATSASLWPMLASQRAAACAIGGTWVPDTFWANLAQTSSALFPIATIVGLLGVLVLRRLSSRRKPTAARSDSARDPANRSRSNTTAQRSAWSTLRSLPMLGLLLYPLALIAVDRLVQPVMVPRYGMPVLPAIAAIIAAGCATMRLRELRTLGAIFLTLGGGELLRVRIAMSDPSPRSASAIVASVDHVGDGLVITDWRGYALPIYVARPSLRSRLRVFDDPTLADPQLAKSIPYERGMTRIMQSFYGWPVMVTSRELPTQPFVFVTEFPERVRVTEGERIAPLTFRMSPQSDRASSD